VINIFGIRFSRVKQIFRRGDEPPQSHGFAARRSMRRKRLLLLAPVLAGLFFVAVAGHGDPAVSKVSIATIVAALKDPLSLFAERSPGGRGSGALLSTKPGWKTASTVPEERVLSTEREREPSAGVLPAADIPAFAVSPEYFAASSDLPRGDEFAEDQGFGWPPFSTFYFVPIPGNPEITTWPVPGPTPSSEPIIAVPEPAAWVMMILGFFAVGVAMRRGAREQTHLPSIRRRQA
jgi:hypothetical protein